MLKKNNINYKTNSYTIKDIYKSYRDSIKINNFASIEYELFKNILRDYFKEISTGVIQDGKIFVLPGRFGEISVKKYKGSSSRMQFDYKSYKELNKPVWYFNDHTFGYRYKFYWNKVNLLVKNCTKYQMIFTRTNKRLLAELLKSNTRDYLEM